MESEIISDFYSIKADLYAMKVCQQRVERNLKRRLPEGKEVLFKFGNMISADIGVVKNARFCLGYPRIALVNQRTGANRDVPLDAILEVRD